MEKKIPSAEEFIKANGKEAFEDGVIKKDYFTRWELEKLLIEFAKLHVEACKEEGAKNAEVDHEYDKYGNVIQDLHTIDKSTILNSYPLENIK